MALSSTVVVSSAEPAEQVLKTHDLECCSRPRTTAPEKLSYGCYDVALAPYGDHWRELRKICVVELFTTKKIMSFRSIREEEVGRTMELIGSHACNSDAVNLSGTMFSLVGNITCRTAFGSCCHDGSRIQFHSILKEVQAIFVGFFLADYFGILGGWVDML